MGNESYAIDRFDPRLFAEVTLEAIRLIRRLDGGRGDLIGIIPGPPTRLMSQYAEVMRSVIHPRLFDMLIYHSYPRHYNIYTVRHMDTANEIFPNKPWFVSEWNTQSCWNPAFGYPGGNCPSVRDFEERTFGMSQAGALVAHFSQLMKRDIYAAAAWPVQMNNMTTFYPDEGIDLDLRYVGGQTFRWLRGTAGMDLVAASNTTSEDEIAYFAYANQRRMIIFVDARDAPSQILRLNIGEFPFFDYSGHRMSGENMVRRLQPDITAATLMRNGNRLRVPIRVDTSHELTRIVLSADSPLGVL